MLANSTNSNTRKASNGWITFWKGKREEGMEDIRTDERWSKIAMHWQGSQRCCKTTCNGAREIEVIFKCFLSGVGRPVFTTFVSYLNAQNNLRKRGRRGGSAVFEGVNIGPFYFAGSNISAEWRADVRHSHLFLPCNDGREYRGYKEKMKKVCSLAFFFASFLILLLECFL